MTKAVKPSSGIDRLRGAVRQPELREEEEAKLKNHPVYVLSPLGETCQVRGKAAALDQQVCAGP